MSSSGLSTIASAQPRLGIIGGSGLCSFPELHFIGHVRPRTKYGFPSDDIVIGEYEGRTVAFLPRHGKQHALAPHKVPYKANLAALQQIGVEFVIGTCIAGSLQKRISPGSLVLPDQFVNLTWGRDASTDADGGTFNHLPMGEPYCRSLRRQLSDVGRQQKVSMHEEGTVAVIQGPRFSTAAESRWFSSSGWDLVNMTQYPECYFARELGICYAAIAAVTDYDVGLHDNLTIDSRGMDAVIAVFKTCIQKTKDLVLGFIAETEVPMSCGCAREAHLPGYESA